MKRWSILLSFLSFACTSPTTNVGRGDFNSNDLDKAWQLKDSKTVLKWIKSLNDTAMSDSAFYDRVGGLANVSNFVYGMADPWESSHYETPLWKRQFQRKNVAKVYGIYAKSKVFMDSVDYEQALMIQDRYFTDSADLSPEQLAGIIRAIDNLYIYSGLR
jgi:hypothetical protein